MLTKEQEKRLNELIQDEKYTIDQYHKTNSTKRKMDLARHLVKTRREAQKLLEEMEIKE